METIEPQRHSLSSLPMLSRLEHLDLVIKNLERQQNLSKWKDESAASSSSTRGVTGGVDRGTAIRDAYFKGSLLDRIAALETRLFQICMELESSSTSSTSTGGSGETSNQRLKKELTRTLPIFNSNINPFHAPLQQHPQYPQEMDEKIEEEKEEEINEIEKPLMENIKEANETCNPKKRKKRSPKKWPRFNLLGC